MRSSGCRDRVYPHGRARGVRCAVRAARARRTVVSAELDAIHLPSLENLTLDTARLCAASVAVHTYWATGSDGAAAAESPAALGAAASSVRCFFASGSPEVDIAQFCGVVVRGAGTISRGRASSAQVLAVSS